MNENGISLIETLLAVVILFFLTATLIPLTFHMKQQFYAQKVQTHAAEVAFNGALLYTRYGVVSGSQQIEDIVYNWTYAENGICVLFENENNKDEFCV